jgi:hypothetical protein
MSGSSISIFYTCLDEGMKVVASTMVAVVSEASTVAKSTVVKVVTPIFCVTEAMAILESGIEAAITSASF